MRHSAYAFTLIEMLMVIAIISLLAALLLPAISMVRDGAKSIDCASRLRQMGMAFGAYSNDWPGRLPYPDGPSGCWNYRLSTDYDDGKLQGIYREPLFRNDPVFTFAALTGFGMNAKLPPALINTDTSVTKGIAPILSQIKEPSLTVLLSDSAGTYIASSYRCTWHIGGNEPWSQEYLVGYVHRSKANLLFVDHHVQSATRVQQAEIFTQTDAYQQLTAADPNASW